MIAVHLHVTNGLEVVKIASHLALVYRTHLLTAGFKKELFVQHFYYQERN